MTNSRKADVCIVGDTEWPRTDPRNIAARMINALHYFFETGSPWKKCIHPVVEVCVVTRRCECLYYNRVAICFSHYTWRWRQIQTPKHLRLVWDDGQCPTTPEDEGRSKLQNILDWSEMMDSVQNCSLHFTVHYRHVTWQLN